MLPKHDGCRHLIILKFITFKNKSSRLLWWTCTRVSYDIPFQGRKFLWFWSFYDRRAASIVNMWRDLEIHFHSHADIIIYLKFKNPLKKMIDVNTLRIEEWEKEDFQKIKTCATFFMSLDLFLCSRHHENQHFISPNTPNKS